MDWGTGQRIELWLSVESEWAYGNLEPDNWLWVNIGCAARPSAHWEVRVSRRTLRPIALN